MKNRILGKDMVVDIGRVYPNDWNPKDNIEESTDNKEYYEAIKEEIEKKGLFEAITVRTTGEGYQILDGYHRWRACSELGYTEIRVNNLGEINDGLARAITLIKEQKKVPISEIKVAEIIKWYKEAGEEDEEIFDDYIKMMDFDFEYDGERGVEEAGEEDSTREVECPKCGQMSKDTDKKEQKYEPTEEMQKVLIAFCDMSVKPTVSARMDAANVGRTTWYEWIKDPRFLEWWKDETEAFMYRSISELNKIAFMKAGKDFRYMELLQTKYANYRKKTDVTSNDKPINDTGDIAKLLSEVLKDEGENRDTKEDGDGEARPEDGDISKEVSS